MPVGAPSFRKPGMGTEVFHNLKVPQEQGLNTLSAIGRFCAQPDIQRSVLKLS